MPYDVKFNNVFDFLVMNREYNAFIQTEEIKRHLLAYESGGIQAKRLLLEAYTSNTSGRFDYAMNFIKFAEKIMRNCNSFKDFCSRIEIDTDSSAMKITQALINESNKGNKTALGNKKASLFMRNLVLIKRNSNLRRLFYWDDIDDLNDTFAYIPVDTVIIEIFKQLHCKNIIKINQINFDSVNQFILDFNQITNKKDLLIWDDLWFWGFITQKTINNRRVHEWNEAKYWSIFYASKAPQFVEKIKKKAQEFLILIGH